MSIGVLSVADKAKLKNLIDCGVQTLLDISTSKEGMKDDITAISEELEIDKSVVTEAINIAYKNSQNKDRLTEKREKLDAVEELLMAVGRA
jgi:hypothetical protein